MDPSHDYDRQLERMRRRDRKRRSNYRLLFMLVLLGGFVVLLAELGRTLAYSQDVGQFLQNLDEKSPAEVKEGLYRYARGFNDHNPVISKASMTVFKVVTGEPFGEDVRQWERWWLEHRATWEYMPPAPASAPDDDLTPIPVPSTMPPAS